MSCKKLTQEEFLARLSVLPAGSFFYSADIDGGHVFLGVEKPHEELCEDGSIEQLKYREYICIGHCPTWAVEIIRQFRLLHDIDLEDIAKYDDPDYVDEDEEDDFVTDDPMFIVDDIDYGTAYGTADNFVDINDANYVSESEEESE